MKEHQIAVSTLNKVKSVLAEHVCYTKNAIAWENSEVITTNNVVVVVVVKTLFKSHTLTSSTISWFPRGACELHRKIHNLNTTYIIYRTNCTSTVCHATQTSICVDKKHAKVFKTE